MLFAAFASRDALGRTAAMVSGVSRLAVRSGSDLAAQLAPSTREVLSVVKQASELIDMLIEILGMKDRGYNIER